jgi:uncharacterized damage-inducible protein DinB
MEPMPHLTGFRREVLSEFQFAEKQILALACAVPAEDYGWARAEDARTFAAVLVHIAAGNLGLLERAGSKDPDVVELYAGIEGEGTSRVEAIVRKNVSLEKTLTEKAAVIDLLVRSFAAVKASWAEASEEELWGIVHLYGELETVRRHYLRMLAHSHEHMGQAIAYVRAMGFQVPWPDPVKEFEEMETTVSAR